MLQVPLHGAGEHSTLQVAPASDQILDLVAVGDSGYILFDDRTVIEHRSYVVTGGADELDAASMSRVVRARADEGRQKGVMNVDDGGRIPRDEIFSKNLHIARQDDELHVQRFKQSELPGLGCSARGRGHWNVFEANAMKGGKLFHVAMVGDDGNDLAG